MLPCLNTCDNVCVSDNVYLSMVSRFLSLQTSAYELHRVLETVNSVNYFKVLLMYIDIF